MLDYVVTSVAILTLLLLIIVQEELCIYVLLCKKKKVLHLWLISPQLQSAGPDVSPVSYKFSQNGESCAGSLSVCVIYSGQSIM